MNKPLAFAAIAESATGIALVVVPSLVARLLLGADLSGAGVAVARVAGIALFALGIACWPGGGASRALCGMLTYNVLAALYLLYLGIRREWVGPVLWPAVIIHVILTILLARTWGKAHQQPAQSESSASAAEGKRAS